MNNKYQSREEKLRNKISEELSHNKPRVDTIIEFVNEFETANLDTIDKFNRIKKLDDNKIRGALKQTINAHGPITHDFINSATKRINGALITNNFNSPIVEFKPFAIRGILLGVVITSLIYYIISLI